MGWQPSVRDSSGCQAQDSTKKMEDTSSLVSCRSALTAPALNYSVSAPPLWLRSILPPPVSLPLVCVLDKTSAEEENGEGGGGGVARAHNRLPGGSTEQPQFHTNSSLYGSNVQPRRPRWEKRRCLHSHSNRPPFFREDPPDKSPACMSGNPRIHVLWIYLN